MAHGRLDISGPADIAHDLAARWPAANLHIVEDAAHTTNVAGLGQIVALAMDRFRAL